MHFNFFAASHKDKPNDLKVVNVTTFPPRVAVLLAVVESPVYYVRGYVWESSHSVRIFVY